MTKTLVVVSDRLKHKKNIMVEGEEGELLVIWTHFDLLELVNDKYSKLNEQFIQQLVNLHQPYYIALDFEHPLDNSKVEELLYLVENQNVVLLEKLNDKFIPLVIPA